VNGRIARKLRKLSEFKPKAERHYFCTNNTNNFMLGDDGRPKRIGGTIIEATSDRDPVTTRAIYNQMKRDYYGTF